MGKFIQILNFQDFKANPGQILSKFITILEA